MSSSVLALSLGQLASLPLYGGRMRDAAGQAKLPQSQVIQQELGANSLDFSPAPCCLTISLEERARG